MSDCILVVDDDRAMQLTIASILEDEGYEVLCARHGREALAHLEHLEQSGGRRPVLIVLDLAMPEMDGYALMDEITRQGFRPQTPLVLVTADSRAQQKAARMEADGYLRKPFALVALVDLVNRLVRAP